MSTNGRKIKEGLFDQNYLRPDPSHITLYDTEKDLIAQKVDWDKYLIKDHKY